MAHTAAAEVPAPGLAPSRNGNGRWRDSSALLLLLSIAVLGVAFLLRAAGGSPMPLVMRAAAGALGVANGTVGRVSSHRTAVADRMYNGALHEDFLGSLQLLDPEVSTGTYCPVPGLSYAA